MQVTDRTKIDARIAGAFRVASDASGTDFDQLARTAARESDLRPDLAATTSSARGLFQFVDQTWYDLVKKEGPSVGLDRLAAQITADGKGGWTVDDPKERAKILSLKTDPLVSSVMAGRFTAANTRTLTETLGRRPSDGEVYAAHVLGAAGATKLVRMAASEPGTTAALAFPKAAAANPDLFYAKGGKPRTASELLARLTASEGAATRIAEAHAAIAGEAAQKLDPKAVAGLVRARVAAAVAGEGPAVDGLDRAAADRFTRSALTEKGLPGASRDVVPATRARVEGWRAKAAADAFTALMRSDGEAPATDPAAADPAAAPAPIRMSAGEGKQVAARAVGGIPYIDPNQPLRLGPASLTAASGGASPLVARPSRLVAAAAAGGPAMPLPMVDGATGTVVRPTAITIGATADAASPSGLVGEGAARVRTVSIAPAASTATTAAAARPLLPPVPGETAGTGAARPRAAEARPADRSNRPLDLLGFRVRTGG